MKIEADASQIEQEIREAAQYPRQLLARAKQRVRQRSLSLKAGVQRKMPVDTGAARASWGSSPANFPAEPLDGIWREEDGGLTIEQGSRRGYIEQLNEGTSTQAPAGFLDTEAEKAARELEDDLANDMGQIIS